MGTGAASEIKETASPAERDGRDAPGLRDGLRPGGGAPPSPTAAARDGSAPAPTPEHLGMLRELAALFAAMTGGRKGWPIIRLAAGVLLVLVGNMVGQVRLNAWNGAFFDAPARSGRGWWAERLRWKSRSAPAA